MDVRLNFERKLKRYATDVQNLRIALKPEVTIVSLLLVIPLRRRTSLFFNRAACHHILDFLREFSPLFRAEI
jgi:hypothetical protein